MASTLGPFRPMHVLWGWQMSAVSRGCDRSAEFGPGGFHGVRWLKYAGGAIARRVLRVFNRPRIPLKPILERSAPLHYGPNLVCLRQLQQFRDGC